MKRFPIEASVFAASLGIVSASVLNSKEKRTVDLQRRSGLKGNSLATDEDGHSIEYRLRTKQGSPLEKTSTLIILEGGLGQALESWDWVSRTLSEDYPTLAYHRRGYGLTNATSDNTTLLKTLLDRVQHTGALIFVSHSMGNLFVVQHLRDPEIREKTRGAAFVDGTDPDLLQIERTSRKRAGKFIQIQLHTLISGVSGLYSWDTNMVERQVSFEPDVQFGYVQFAYTPRNIFTSVEEYFQVPTAIPSDCFHNQMFRLVIGSTENTEQQQVLASKIEATYDEIPGSTHRSILGNLSFASAVSDCVRSAINELG